MEIEKRNIKNKKVICIRIPYDKKKVTAKLKQKEYDDIFLRGRGRLDDFIGFLYESGFLQLFDSIDSRMQRKPEIPRRFLHYCLCLKPVVECANIHQLPTRLLEDTDTLKELGFTIVEIENGFSVKNKANKNIPVNINAFYDEMGRLPEEETKKFFETGIHFLKKKRFIPRKKGIYAIDAVKLLITGDKKYQNYGKITYRKDGKLIKEKGYKLVFIQKVDGEDFYVVAACIIPLNQNESTVAKTLVKEALSNLGEDSIKILLFDRGFLSGDFFDFLGKKNIRFVCPTKENQHLTRYMRGLHRIGEEIKVTLGDKTVLAGYNHLIKMEAAERKVNGVLILKQGKKERKQVKQGEEFGFLTNLSTSKPEQIEKVYNLYSKRWKIETNGNRELKQEWYLNKFPSQSWTGICAHIYFTLFMFNTVAAFRSKKGRALSEKGFRSLRNKHFRPFPNKNKIIAIAGGYVGTYSLKEFLDIFNLPPPTGKHSGPVWFEFPDGHKEFHLL